MPLSITPLYAGVLTLLFVFLSARVIAGRASAGIMMGDSGAPQLLRRRRVHGNFAEYVPLALVLMLMAELQAVPHWQLHAMGILLTAGRIIHAYGVSQDPEVIGVRVVGMALTFFALLSGAALNLWQLL